MEKQSFLFGIHPILEAFAAGKELDKILIRKGLKGDYLPELMAMIRETGTPYQFVPVEKLNRITKKNHQGVIAFAALVSYSPIEEIVQRVFEAGKIPIVLAMDGITDVRNLGAMARSAEVAGVDALLIPDKGSAQINPEAMKSSAGALNVLPICRTSNLAHTLQELKSAGLKILGATERADQSLYDEDLRDPLVWVMGSEESGMSQNVKMVIDNQVKIPQQGKIASLNVSAATAVLLFETQRQRNRVE